MDKFVLLKLNFVLIFLAAAAAAVVFAQDLGDEKALSPRYNCPLYDIDIYGNDIDSFLAIGMWQECGT